MIYIILSKWNITTTLTKKKKKQKKNIIKVIKVSKNLRKTWWESENTQKYQKLNIKNKIYIDSN